ncbi:TPA: helix-turn-helix transcriptional regulator [Streptococcus suis]|nr:helix-turn-helix transcriptional regulator [Streptococcus suis]HEL1607903.1 helix-turn-helix transcriptional regulator [Streptococcus suis]HEL2203479.1 helix-turn-helix transcriptional regulator [Streptococcus suis]HEM2728262.1 helix-turn-helix transcriptional regulator [Streptococcus suis]HEM5167001.1 helix-turn-helix transcriptional regulator [Streptococcus suis]
MWEKLKQLLAERRITIAELDRLSGIPRKSLENMKKHDPSFFQMEKIADVLDISLDEFRGCRKD